MGKNERRDITEIVEQYLCHSCGSCFASCGHESIHYEHTSGGYLFPKINYDTCTNCGLCYEVCPGDHFTSILEEKTPNDPFVGDIIEVYSGKSADPLIYKNSQSGGVATSLIKYLLDTKQVEAAIVTVGTNDEEFVNSKAIMITSSEDLLQSQKSKYTPTNIISLFENIDDIKGQIALVGLSCHMHGFENLTKINRKLKNKVIKIGLICERVMVHSAIEFFSRKITDEKIMKLNFKDPSLSKYPGDMSAYSDDGKVHILDRKHRKNMKDFFTPTRCFLCFDKMNIYADIVLGDPHGVSDVDREDGETMVITRNSLGQKIIHEILKSGIIELKSVSLDEAIRGQKIEEKRQQWFANIKAWESLGYRSPEYPKEVFEKAIVPDEKSIQKAVIKIKHSLTLDHYISRSDLLRAAEEYSQAMDGSKTLINRLKRFLKLK